MNISEHWNSNTLATWWEELTRWKRPWCWEGLRARGEGDDRGWDGWMASSTRWTWVWVDSGSWWWTGRPGMLRFMGLCLFATWLSDWTELNWLNFQNHLTHTYGSLGFPGGSVVKNLPANAGNAGDTGSRPSMGEWFKDVAHNTMEYYSAIK